MQGVRSRVESGVAKSCIRSAGVSGLGLCPACCGSSAPQLSLQEVGQERWSSQPCRTQTQTRTHIYIYIYICIFICIFIYMYIYIYIYIHTHTRSLPLSLSFFLSFFFFLSFSPSLSFFLSLSLPVFMIPSQKFSSLVDHRSFPISVLSWTHEQIHPPYLLLILS